MPVSNNNNNNIEQKDLFSLSSSPPKSMDNTNPIPMQQSSLYNQSTIFYQHQRNSPPVYRPSSLQFDFGQNQLSYHDSHTRVKAPVFDEFLTNSSSSTYVPVNNNSSLSVHSYMNVSFQDTINNSASITPSSFNHHNTTYPY